ncbi:MAG: hypothetical protein DA330_00865 [Nitrososphaera sp.]|nr:hypothetical protein [Nitrososphaera sp.]
MLNQIQDAWQGMLQDPEKREQFRQFAMALMQSKPDVTPFGNIGSAIQRSQDYVLAMRELDRKNRAEADKQHLAEEGLTIQRAEAEANAGYRAGVLENQKAELAQTRRDRIARNVQERLNRKTQKEIAGLEIQGRKDVASARNQIANRLPAAKVQLLTKTAEALMKKNPGMDIDTAWLEAVAQDAAIPAQLFNVQYGEDELIYPGLSDVIEQRRKAMGLTGSRPKAPAAPQTEVPPSAAPTKRVPQPVRAYTKKDTEKAVGQPFTYKNEVYKVVHVNQDGSGIAVQENNPGVSVPVSAEQLLILLQE